VTLPNREAGVAQRVAGAGRPGTTVILTATTHRFFTTNSFNYIRLGH
jgi:hypothetical protein